MKKNIILSVVLSLVMMVSILPISAFAAEEIPSFVDPNTKTITIANPTDMRWLSTYDGSIEGLDATFVNWTINIVDDIDLNNVPWTPIANFRGKMIGVTDVENGTRTISNLKVNVTDVNAAGAGLCAKSGGGARFENLKISDSEITSSVAYAGAFIGNGFTSYFENCHTVNTSVHGDRFVGGIVGFNYGGIKNCSVTATNNETVISAKLISGRYAYLQNSGDNVGGIVGQIGEGNFFITGCTVDGIKVEATRQVGGIAGMAMYENTVSGCTVSNTNISACLERDFTLLGNTQSRTAAVGGVVGQIQPHADTEITITANTVGPNTTITRTTGSTAYCGWVLGDATRVTDASQYNTAGNICDITTSLPIVGN